MSTVKKKKTIIIIIAATGGQGRVKSLKVTTIHEILATLQKCTVFSRENILQSASTVCFAVLQVKHKNLSQCFYRAKAVLHRSHAHIQVKNTKQ